MLLLYFYVENRNILCSLLFYAMRCGAEELLFVTLMLILSTKKISSVHMSNLLKHFEYILCKMLFAIHFNSRESKKRMNERNHNPLKFT